MRPRTFRKKLANSYARGRRCDGHGHGPHLVERGEFGVPVRNAADQPGNVGSLETHDMGDKDNGIECLKPSMVFNKTRWKRFSENEKPATGMRGDSFVILADTLKR